MPTVVESIRLLLAGRYFLLLEKGVLLAEGTIVNVLDHDTVLVDLWRGGDPETTTTHIFALNAMTWDERTQSGLILTQQRNATE
jgi:hypothetical protein